MTLELIPEIKIEDIKNIKKRKTFLNSVFNKLKNSVYNIFSPKSL